MDAPIRSVERALYDEIWSGVSQYGNFSPGERNLDLFLAMSQAGKGMILDAGCGSGRGGLALKAKGFDVMLADLSLEGLCPEAKTLPFVKACLWEDLAHLPYLARAASGLDPVVEARFDYVYCCDVLEHLPMEFTMLAVGRMLDVASVGLFVSVGLLPDCFGAFVGRQLHHTVQPFTWWRDRFRELAVVVECRDLINSGVYWIQ